MNRNSPGCSSALMKQSRQLYRKHNNPEQSDSSYHLKEERLNSELLRILSHQTVQTLKKIWNLNHNEIIQFFSQFKTIYQLVDFRELVQLKETKVVPSQQKVYMGQVENKQKHGLGITIYRDGHVYEGSYRHNQKQGNGCQIYANGNMYIGSFHENKKHGKGVFYWFSYCQGNSNEGREQKSRAIQGTWWGGLPDGEGQHEKTNGDFYMGHFKNGLKHGEGVEYYSNGDKYTGEFVNGLPQGFGTYNWADGSFYRGDFKQGFRNGYGVWCQAEGGQYYKGHYMIDRKHGYGIYDWANGYVYKGNFIDDQRCGEGELHFNGQMVYSGFWLNGQRCDEEDYKAQGKQMKTATSRHECGKGRQKNCQKIRKIQAQRHKQ